MTTEKTVSDEPMDFASLILYISSKHPSPASEECIKNVSTYNEVAIVDVAVSGRPAFVRGVPTVVDPNSNDIFAGSKAIGKIKQWLEKQVVSYPTTHERGCTLESGFEVANDDGEEPVQRSLEELLRKRG